MKEIIKNIFQELEIIVMQNEDDFDRGKGKYYIWEFLEQKEKYLNQVNNGICNNSSYLSNCNV